MWGITPGASRFGEAQAQLTPLSSLSNFGSFGSDIGTISPDYFEGNVNISTSFLFFKSPPGDLVDHISFSVMTWVLHADGTYYIETSPVFGEVFAFYEIYHLLFQYGAPATVSLLTTSRLPKKGELGGYFRILLVYPEQGFLVHYDIPMKVVGPNVLGCPANAQIKMELYPSGDGDTFFGLLDSHWQQVVMKYPHLEEKTSMTIDEFYETFRQPSDECIETPADLWPEPDQGGG